MANLTIAAKSRHISDIAMLSEKWLFLAIFQNITNVLYVS